MGILMDSPAFTNYLIFILELFIMLLAWQALFHFKEYKTVRNFAFLMYYIVLAIICWTMGPFLPLLG